MAESMWRGERTVDSVSDGASQMTATDWINILLALWAAGLLLMAAHLSDRSPLGSLFLFAWAVALIAAGPYV